MRHTPRPRTGAAASAPQEPLPETADELCAIVGALGAQLLSETILFGSASDAGLSASERSVNQLARARLSS